MLAFIREAVICTLLPLLTGLLVVFGADLALDALGELRGRDGFSAPEAVFVLFIGLLIVVAVFQVFLAITAWRQLRTKLSQGAEAA